MSWIGSYFSLPTPHDAQRRQPPPHTQRLLEEPATTAAAAAAASDSLNGTKSPDLTAVTPAAQNTTLNANRSKVIFGAGVTFFAFSMLITRRSFARRKTLLSSQLTSSSVTAAAARTKPPGVASPASNGNTFYTNAPAHAEEQATKVSGAMEAVEALNIATINVLSVAMMATGAALWYMDINSMEDARRLLRGGLGVDGSGRSEQEAEEDFEVWIARTLAKGDAKDAAALAGKRVLEEK